MSSHWTRGTTPSERNSSRFFFSPSPTKGKSTSDENKLAHRLFSSNDRNPLTPKNSLSYYSTASSPATPIFPVSRNSRISRNNANDSEMQEISETTDHLEQSILNLMSHFREKNNSFDEYKSDLFTLHGEVIHQSKSALMNNSKNYGGVHEEEFACGELHADLEKLKSEFFKFREEMSRIKAEKIEKHEKSKNDEKPSVSEIQVLKKQEAKTFISNLVKDEVSKFQNSPPPKSNENELLLQVKKKSDTNTLILEQNLEDLETLKNWKLSVTKEVTKLSEDSENKKNLSSEETRKKFENLENQVAQVNENFGDASKNFKKFENQVSKNMENQNNIISSFENNLNNLNLDIDKEKEERENDKMVFSEIKEFMLTKKKSDEIVDEKLNKIDEIEEDLETIKSEIVSEVSKSQVKLVEEANKKREQKDLELSKEEEKKRKGLEERIEKKISKLSGDLGSMKSEIVLEVKESQVKLVEEESEKRSFKDLAISEEGEKKRKEMEERIKKEINSSTINLLDSKFLKKQEYFELFENVEKLTKDIDSNASSLHENSSKISKILENFEDQTRQLEGLGKKFELIENLESLNDEKIKNFLKKLEEQDSETQNIFNEMKSETQNSLHSFQQITKKMMDSKLQEFQASQTESIENLKKLREEDLEKLKKYEEETANSIESIESSQNEKLKNFETLQSQTLNDFESKVNTSFSSKLSDYSTDLKSSFSKASDEQSQKIEESEKKIKLLENSLSLSKQEIFEETKLLFSSEISKIKETLEHLSKNHDTLENSLNSVKSEQLQTTKFVENFKKLYDSESLKVISKFENLKTQIFQNSKNLEQSKKLLDFQTKQFKETTSKHKVFENTLAELSNKFLSLFEEQNEIKNTIVPSIKEQFQGDFNTLQNSFDVINKDFTSLLGDMEKLKNSKIQQDEKAMSLETQFVQVSSLLNQKFSNYFKEISEKFGTQESKFGSDIRKFFEEKVENRIQEIEGIITRIYEQEKKFEELENKDFLTSENWENLQLKVQQDLEEFQKKMLLNQEINISHSSDGTSSSISKLSTTRNNKTSWKTVFLSVFWSYFLVALTMLILDFFYPVQLYYGFFPS